MNPWQLIAILEKNDPSFRDLFYPKHLRCPLSKRIAQSIEEHWPVYFPTRKECRGRNWSTSIPENELLYQPHPSSKKELNAWKARIKGTIAEGRSYRTDRSWKRFFQICANYPRLQPPLHELKPAADFLIQEEAIWPRHGGVLVGQEELLTAWRNALLAPGSPYRFAEPQRLRFLRSRRPTMDKIQMIHLIRQLFDRPLMALAVLEECAASSHHAPFWLSIEKHITAIVINPEPLTFRKVWLEHAMQSAGAIKRTGKSSRRKWARLLLDGDGPALSEINAKAVEVSCWTSGKKRPSVKNVRRSWQIISKRSELPLDQSEETGDFCLLSWMITFWLENHFKQIAAGFNNDTARIQRYYRRFFLHLKIARKARKKEGAGGFFSRQP
jgi:hypothetical protein